MHFSTLAVVSFAAIFSTITAAPTWKEGTCGPEEDAACYPDGSNGKRSPTPVAASKLPTIFETPTCTFPNGAPNPGCVDGIGYLKRDAPFVTDTPNVDHHVDDNYEEKRSIDPHLPTDEDGYLRRSVPVEEGDNIVIGSKRSPAPEEPEKPSEDVGAYDEEKRKRRLPIDETYPFPQPEDEYDYIRRSVKRSPAPAPMHPEGTCGPEEDLACYPDGSNGKRSVEETKPARPIDGDYPPPNDDSYPVKREPEPEGTCGPEEDLACYQPPPPRPIDGDYPVPKDDSYPVKREPEPEGTCGPEEDLACYQPPPPPPPEPIDGGVASAER
jgi:hypothetical protein